MSTSNLTYCAKWGYPGAIQIISQEEARMLHRNGALYGVIIGNLNKPLCFIHVRLETSYIGVGMLDEFQRESKAFDFEVSGQERMFLSSIRIRSFVAKSEDVSEGKMWIFKPEGFAIVERNIYRYEGKVRKVAQTSRQEERVDSIQRHWFSVPPFGQYENLLNLSAAFPMYCS